MKFTYLAVICLLFLVQGLNASGTYNFPFEDITLYGVSANGTDDRVLSTPFDFILSPQGYPVVLDTYAGKVFVFYQPYLNNFTEYNTSEFVAITIEMMAPDKYILVTTNGVYQTTDFITFEQLNISTQGTYLLGVAFDSRENILYISDALNSQVNAYDLDTLSLVNSYGGYTNISRPGETSTTSLSNPELLAVDNQGGLWVVDTGNNRVLHFPAGSNVADIVLGQPDFTTKEGGAFSINNSAQLFNPNGVALDASNQNIYVTDQTGRVLRWTAPFTNGQNASGVLDAASDLGGFNIYSVRVRNNPDGSVRVFYSDSGNGRIVSGQALPASPSSSFTSTASPTSTSSASLSSTTTASLSSTSTASLSSTSTASVSATSTASLSSTSTASVSATSTASLSSTSTASVSATSTASLSSTSTASLSSTTTASVSATSSPSLTSSASPSTTASLSATSTASLSSTSTASLSATSTASLSATSTASLSATSTASLSATSTASLSATASASLSATSAASLSSTSSASQSSSSSASQSSSSSASLSATSAPSASASPLAVLPSESSSSSISASSSAAPVCPSASPSSAPVCPSASPSPAPVCPASPSPAPSGCDCCDELRANNALINAQIDEASTQLATILRKLSTLSAIEDEVSQLRSVNSKVGRILNEVQQLNNNNNNGGDEDYKRSETRQVRQAAAVAQESGAEKKVNWVNSLF